MTLKLINNIKEDLKKELELTNFDANQEDNNPGKRLVFESGTYPGYLVEYVDLGDQVFEGYKGAADTVNPAVHLGVVVFRHNEDGELEHTIINTGRFPIKVSLNERAKFRKIFRKFNYNDDPNMRHFAQFLGAEHSYNFKVEKRKSSKGNSEFNTVDFESAVICEEGTFGNMKRVRLPDIDEKDYAVFLWNSPTMEQWNSILRGKEGTPPTAKNNYFQNQIINAKNFKGSAVEHLLASSEVDYTTPYEEDAKEVEGVEGAALPEVNQEISEDVPEMPKAEVVRPATMPTNPLG